MMTRWPTIALACIVGMMMVSSSMMVAVTADDTLRYTFNSAILSDTTFQAPYSLLDTRIWSVKNEATGVVVPSDQVVAPHASSIVEIVVTTTNDTIRFTIPQSVAISSMILCHTHLHLDAHVSLTINGDIAAPTTVPYNEPSIISLPSGDASFVIGDDHWIIRTDVVTFDCDYGNTGGIRVSNDGRRAAITTSTTVAALPACLYRINQPIVHDIAAANSEQFLDLAGATIVATNKVVWNAADTWYTSSSAGRPLTIFAPTGGMEWSNPLAIMDGSRRGDASVVFDKCTSVHFASGARVSEAQLTWQTVIIDSQTQSAAKCSKPTEVIFDQNGQATRMDVMVDTPFTVIMNGGGLLDGQYIVHAPVRHSWVFTDDGDSSVPLTSGEYHGITWANWDVTMNKTELFVRGARNIELYNSSITCVGSPCTIHSSTMAQVTPTITLHKGSSYTSILPVKGGALTEVNCNFGIFEDAIVRLNHVRQEYSNIYGTGVVEFGPGPVHIMNQAAFYGQPGQPKLTVRSLAGSQNMIHQPAQLSLTKFEFLGTQIMMFVTSELYHVDIAILGADQRWELRNGGGWTHTLVEVLDPSFTASCTIFTTTDNDIIPSWTHTFTYVTFVVASTPTPSVVPFLDFDIGTFDITDVTISSPPTKNGVYAPLLKLGSAAEFRVMNNKFFSTQAAIQTNGTFVVNNGASVSFQAPVNITSSMVFTISSTINISSQFYIEPQASLVITVDPRVPFPRGHIQTISIKPGGELVWLGTLKVLIADDADLKDLTERVLIMPTGGKRFVMGPKFVEQGDIFIRKSDGALIYHPEGKRPPEPEPEPEPTKKSSIVYVAIASVLGTLCIVAIIALVIYRRVKARRVGLPEYDMVGMIKT